MADLPDVLEMEAARLAHLVLNNCERTLVVDSRPFMTIDVPRVSTACNIHCPPILKRRSGGFIALENVVPCPIRRQRLLNGQYDNVVVYDSSTVRLDESPKDSNLYSVLKSLPQQVPSVNLFFLVGGYEAFSKDYPEFCSEQKPQMDRLEVPCLTLGKLPRRSPETRPEPVEILPFLYLGDYSHASKLQVLQNTGITAIINVSISCDNKFEETYRYMNIPVEDNNCAELFPWFSEAIAFIDAVKQEGGRVLVHCQAGISRSATICLAYLISTSHFNLESAYENIRAKRSVIAPNLNFMRQLQDFEKTILPDSNVKPASSPSLEMNTGISPKHFDRVSAGFKFPFSGRNSSPCSPLISPI
ncbi:hypothetical protein ScPMuIL_000631 [Solemya velum]